MKKIKLLFALIFIVTINTKTFSQEIIKNDTIYVNDIPVGLFKIDTINKINILTSFSLIDEISLYDILCKNINNNKILVKYDYIDIDYTIYDIEKLHKYHILNHINRTQSFKSSKYILETVLGSFAIIGALNEHYSFTIIVTTTAIITSIICEIKANKEIKIATKLIK